MPTLAKKVFLSSTFIDLKDYREAAIHACRRVGLIPVYMEDFPPDPRGSVAFCKAKVEEADLFLGVYAHRYGYVPDGSKVSITEMEYEWAIERKLPVHLFVVDPDYSWPPSKVDKGRDFKRLESFKKKIGKEHTLKKFRDVEAFKEDVLLLGHDLARTEAAAPTGEPAPTRRSLPTPPEIHSIPPYIQTTGFIGRRKELNDLDAWARSSDTMLVVEAIGGVGKSALTWEWVQDRASKAIPGLAGILWWSFYEGGASTASFVREALAYVTQVDPEDLRTLPQDEQVQRLLTELRRHPYLLALDGFERLLTAYHQLDPSKVRDDQVKTDHRAATNPRTDDLLRQFVGCSPSKFLITTRLMPSSLENRAHQSLPGVRHRKLPGLAPADGESLLKSLGAHGDSTTIRQFLRQFDNHSLLITVLAGRILDYRPASGNFDHWLADPKEGGSLHLGELDLKQRRTHILAYAFDGLDVQKKQFLSQVAALSDAADYATLSTFNPYLPPPPKTVPLPEPSESKFDLSVLRGELKELQSWAKHTWLNNTIRKREVALWEKSGQQQAAYDAYQSSLRTYARYAGDRAAIASFDAALSDLENRGLLQWDRHSNSYDLHPVVRGYAFDQMEPPNRTQTYERIIDHFESLPPENPEAATELAQIRNTLQIYRALIGSNQLDSAADLFISRLSTALFSTVTSYPLAVELLTPMFPGNLKSLPSLSSIRSQGNILNAFGAALDKLGRTKEAQRVEQLGIKLALESGAWPRLAIRLHNHSGTMLSANKLATAACCIELAREISLALGYQELIRICLLGSARLHVLEGRLNEAYSEYEKVTMQPAHPHLYRGRVESLFCEIRHHQGALRAEDLDQALSSAKQWNNLPDQHQIYHLRAEIALSNGALHEAVEAAEHALEISKKTGEPDSYSQGCLARALALQGHCERARTIVEEIGLRDDWQAAEVFLQVGALDEAREYALCAYEKAWADGPPHIRWWPLENAKRILNQLGIPEPQLPPFDPSRIEPLPYEAEIRAAINKLKTAYLWRL